VDNGKVLLISNSTKSNGDFYCLPGGGQNKYETFHEAVVRECKEETGYFVNPLKLVGVCEEICVNDEVREKDPNYAHKIYQIFLCELANNKPEFPTEKDGGQIGCEWVNIDNIHNIRLLPQCLGEQIVNVFDGSAPVFLGTDLTRFNNG